jgi:DNA mismatch repair protein MutH
MINKKEVDVSTKEKIIQIGKSLVGKTIKEIVGHDLDEGKLNKGSVGQLIEECAFGQKPHSDSNPDFMPAEVELKVAPVKKIKKGEYSAKERIVLNRINFSTEPTDSFENSSFWKKNKNLYILFYEYMKDLPKAEYKIYKEMMLELSNEDRKQIEEDWKVIARKIENNQAGELSEGDTLYLGACTKGVNGKSTTTEKNGNEAKSRAFSYKTTYVSHLLRKKTKDDFSLTEGTGLTIENLVIKKTKLQVGKTKLELSKEFGIQSNSKNSNEMLIAAMLGHKGKKVSQSIEFKKANIVFKTIVLTENNKLKESMSLPRFFFKELVQENWEDSELNEYFSLTRFAFCIFKGPKANPVFQGIKFWNMPATDIEKYVKYVWQDTNLKLLEGNVYKSKDLKSNRNTFIKSKANKVIHVRPKARNKNDEDDLPTEDLLTKKTKHTKQCFWINSSYLLDTLKNSHR